MQPFKILIHTHIYQAICNFDKLGEQEWVDWLWEYSCDEEYLEELNKKKILEYSLLAVLPWNKTWSQLHMAFNLWGHS